VDIELKKLPLDIIDTGQYSRPPLDIAEVLMPLAIGCMWRPCVGNIRGNDNQNRKPMM
jgi:hypothetical protein